MNELKPEDVMRALDILDKMDFFQGQRAGRELWFEKPFEVQEQDVADFSQGIAFVKNLITNGSALLREKDALLAEWDAKCNDYETHLIGKDAEIERLKDEYEIECETRFGKITIPKMRSLGEGAELIYKEIRAEAITEFENKLYEVVDDTYIERYIAEIAKKLKGATDGKSDL